MKTAVITGASSGLGAALAKEFKSQGFLIVAVSRTAPAPELHDVFIAADLADRVSLQSCLDQLKSQCPQIDVLINNAGIGIYESWDNIAETDLRREFEIDFFAPVEMTRQLLPQLAGGSVINISSAAALIPVACMGSYNAVKAALRMYSITLQMERRDLHVLNVCPGRINTGFSKRALGTRKVPSTPGSSAAGTEDFARKVFQSYQKRKRELIYPWWYTLAAVFCRHFPGLAEKLNRKIWSI